MGQIGYVPFLLFLLFSPVLFFDYHHEVKKNLKAGKKTSRKIF